MRFLVLGGAGDMGSGIVRELSKLNGVNEVSIGDINLKRAEELKNELGDKISIVRVDASNVEELKKVIEEVNPDVVVSAIGPFFEFAEKTTRAAVEAGYNYVDICDDYDGTMKALELSKIAEENGVTAVNGIGWTPGISNLLAKLGSEMLDEVDTIDIAWVGSAADSEGLAVVAHVFHAVSGEIPQYENGELIHVPAWREKVKRYFPEEFGEVNVIFTGHPEPITLPKYINAKNVYLRGALIPEWQNSLLKAFYKLRLIGKPSRNKRTARFIHKIEGIFRSGGIPKSVVRVDVIGKKDGEDVKLVYAAVETMRKLTSVPASIAARYLASNPIDKYGVFPPEAVFNAREFLDKLKAHGIRFYELVDDEWARI